jgi:glycosyltransferase involved in cell wall biosynthesis
MTSYNHEKYLSESIESVLNQSFTDFELLIVDDCSKDSSPRIIENYQRSDRRIQAFFHRKNQGIAKTVNELLNAAQGKYLAFISSDDVWVPSKLEKQLAVLEKVNSSLVVWSEAEIINELSVPTGETFTKWRLGSSKRKSGNILNELLDNNFIFGNSLIFKREYAKKIQFDEQLKYLNDYKFFVDLAKEHSFYFFSEPLAKYRLHGKNTHSGDNENWVRDFGILGKYFLHEFGSSIPKKTRAYWLFRIGMYYSLLNQDKLAKYFFLEATRNQITATNLTFALTNGKGFSFKILHLLRSKERLRNNNCFRKLSDHGISIVT